MAKQNTVTARASSSAAGAASQTPSAPNRAVIPKVQATKNRKVRRKEMKAEVFPSEKAVNIAEEKIL